MSRGVKPTLGVVGGMGPYAGLAFVKHVLDAIPAKCEADYPRMILDNNVHIPSRHRAVCYGGKSPVSDMVITIEGLRTLGAQIIAVPCNAVHFFHTEVQKQISIPWLSMPHLVGEAVNQNFQRPLVLGAYITTEFRLYDTYLSRAIYPTLSERPVVDQIIDLVKTNQPIPETAIRGLEALIVSKVSQIDCVLLACTELSILHQKHPLLMPVIFDSSLIYAHAVARKLNGGS